MPRQQSTAEIYDDFPKQASNEQILLSLRKMARLRTYLKNITAEVSKTLGNVKDCKKSVDNVMDSLGEINATVKNTTCKQQIQ